MSISKEQARQSILANMLNTLVKSEGSYNYDIASAVAQEISEATVDVDDLFLQLFPQTFTREPYWTYHLETYGLTKIAPTYAVGTVQFTGKVLGLVPMSTVVISNSGQRYTTDTSIYLDSYGVGSVTVTSVVSGVDGNCNAGAIVAVEAANPDIYTVGNTEAISGGAAEESIEDSKKRIKDKASKPAHSGNRNQYVTWVKEGGGVGEVTVIGAGEHSVTGGNVEIYFSNADGTIPNSTRVQEIQDYLNTNDRIPINDNTIVYPYVALNCSFVIDTVTVTPGSKTKAEYIAEFTSDLQNAIITQGFLIRNYDSQKKYLISSTLPISKVGTMIYNIEGTNDYTGLTINGSASNLVIPYNKIIVITSVVINNYVEI